MSYYLKYLFEEIILEGEFKSSCPAAKVANKIIDNLKLKNIKIENSHYNFSGTEINSFYFDVVRNIKFLGIIIPLRFKCRSSNHIKPDLEKATDIKVLIPNQEKFDNDMYKFDDLFYIFGEEYNNYYINQGIKDIINKFNEETEIIENIIKKINKYFISYYFNHEIDDVSKKYNIPKRYLKRSWFSNLVIKISEKLRQK